MPPFYEFECEKGHVTERLVKMGTASVPCEECDRENGFSPAVVVSATRILSPTPTTFVAAGGRKL